MESLKKRLSNRKEEFLEFTKDFGRPATMDEYDIHTYDSLEKLLEDWTGDKDYGKFPKFGGVVGGGGINVFETFRDALQSYKRNKEQRIFEMARQLEEVKTENEMLRRWIFKGFGEPLLNLMEILED